MSIGDEGIVFRINPLVLQILTTQIVNKEKFIYESNRNS